MSTSGRSGEVAELFQAISADDGDAVRRLLVADPDFVSRRGPDGVSAIMTALYRRRPQAMAALLADDPELDLFEAAALGRAERLQELLGAGAGSAASARSADGFTALHLAAFFGQPESARLLLAGGADPNAVAANPMRVMPLHSAAASSSPAIVRLLLERGAEVNAVQQAGYTPLHSSANNGDLESAELLLAHGADRERRDENGKTAHDVAAAGGRAALAERLRPQ